MNDARKIILVVEDDPECLEAVVDTLGWDGYTADTAANGSEALQRLGANPPPDLILLDLMMPVMDGWQFLVELRSRPELAQIPVALLSAEADLSGRAATLDVAGHITKPVELDELLSVVRALAGPPD